VSVEQVGNEGEVELGVSCNERLRGKIFAAVEFFGVLKFSTRKEIILAERGLGAKIWGQLVEENGVVLTVLDI